MEDNSTEFTVSGITMWNIMVALMTCDEMVHNRMMTLRNDPHSHSDALLHLAQNHLILTTVVREVAAIMNSSVTDEEKRKLEEFMKRMKRD